MRGLGTGCATGVCLSALILAISVCAAAIEKAISNAPAANHFDLSQHLLFDSVPQACPVRDTRRLFRFFAGCRVGIESGGSSRQRNHARLVGIFSPNGRAAGAQIAFR